MNRQHKDFLLDTRVDFGLTYATVVDLIRQKIQLTEYGSYICTVNPEFLVDAQYDVAFKNIINDSFLSLPDGSGILYAKRYMDVLDKYKFFPLKLLRSFIFIFKDVFDTSTLNFINNHKVSGSTLLYELCALADREHLSVAFIGGWGRDAYGNLLLENIHVAERTAAVLKKEYPGMNVIAATSDFSWDEASDAACLNYIKNCMTNVSIDHVDIVFVSFGHPKQEKWLDRNLKKIPAKVGIGLGGSFDYVINIQSKAPKKIQRLNLEWLYRLLKEPWRFKRIYKAVIVFPLKIFLKTIDINVR